MELKGDAEARREWIRIVPELRKARIVTLADRSLLIALCFEWSTLLESRRKARVDHLVTRRGTGAIGVNPYTTIANRALANLVKLWVEIGLTPSARTRIATVDAIPSGDWEFDTDPPRPN